MHNKQMKNLSNYSDAFDSKSTKKFTFSHLFQILHAHSNNVKYAIRIELNWTKKIEIILMNFYVSFMETRLWFWWTANVPNHQKNLNIEHKLTHLHACIAIRIIVSIWPSLCLLLWHMNHAPTQPTWFPLFYSNS